MSASSALREISERLIRLMNDVNRAEDGDAHDEADTLADLRREALDDIERIVDDVLLRGER